MDALFGWICRTPTRSGVKGAGLRKGFGRAAVKQRGRGAPATASATALLHHFTPQLAPGVTGACKPLRQPKEED